MIRPMLAGTANENEWDRLLDDPDWAVEPKLDGQRVLLQLIDGDPLPIGRDGQRLNIDPAPFEPFFDLVGEWVFDGELVDGRYWLFDLLHRPLGTVLAEPHWRRRTVLESAGMWNLVPVAATAEGKRALFNRVRDEGGEGVVFKRHDAPYQPGRSRNMLKAKFTRTADLIVTEVGRGGACNAAVATLSDGQLVEVATVSLVGKPAVAVGDVVEVRYLYVTPGGRLFQPRLVRRRADKPAVECTADQVTV